MKVHLHQSLREICVPAYRINRIICDVNVLLSYLGTCSPSKMDDFFCDHTPEIVNGMTPAHSVKIKGSFLLDDSIITEQKKNAKTGYLHFPTIEETRSSSLFSSCTLGAFAWRVSWHPFEPKRMRRTKGEFSSDSSGESNFERKNTEIRVVSN